MKKKLPREITIKFSVVGTCYQTIQIDDGCELTDKQIIEELESGGLVTTVQENGHLCEVTGFNFLSKIGTVVGSDTDCEYEDFKNASL